MSSVPEPAFAAPWHAHVFALTVHLNEAGHFVWGEWAQRFGAMLKQHGLEPDALIARLQSQLTNSLTGILHDMVRQKMVNILIETLHNVPV